jgi:uncharacterized membrane protein
VLNWRGATLRGPSKIAPVVRTLDRIVASGNLCIAIPLAVFGAEHLLDPPLVMNLVPAYMPWRMFWVYFVGCALIAAAASIATKTIVHWSGLLFGIMMFLFVAMIHLRGALILRNDRIIWTIVFREMSFGGAGWILAATAADGWRGRRRTVLIAAGRVCIVLAAVVFGAEHFLHPTVLPGVPLRKEMPMWVPAPMVIDYVTGVALLVLAGSAIVNRNTWKVAAIVGAWLLLLTLIIYGPVLFLSLLDPAKAVKVVGINYFADTLLFAGTVLALARAAPLSG